MKECELDKFVNKLVKVTDFENEEFQGFLLKIIDSKTYQHGMEQLHAIRSGYHLARLGRGGIDFRKSHIKTIKEI